MRGKSNPELKAEVIRLRLEERKSLKDIHRLLKVPKGTLSTWLRSYPLTKTEQRAVLEKAWASMTRRGTPKKDRGIESKYHLMANRKLTRLDKAKISEAAVMFRLVVHGYSPFGSVFDGDRTDWLVEIPGGVRKIQVKTAKEQTTGLPVCPLCCVEGNKPRRYTEGEFDVLVGYDVFTDVAYVWTWKELEHLKASVSICPEAAERWDKLCR
jgi:transposase-like protein